MVKKKWCCSMRPKLIQPLHDFGGHGRVAVPVWMDELRKRTPSMRIERRHIGSAASELLAQTPVFDLQGIEPRPQSLHHHVLGVGALMLLALLLLLLVLLPVFPAPITARLPGLVGGYVVGGAALDADHSGVHGAHQNTTTCVWITAA